MGTAIMKIVTNREPEDGCEHKRSAAPDNRTP
jgi:hypothetical protein